MLLFYPRDTVLAQYLLGDYVRLCVCLCVRLSVCLYHTNQMELLVDVVVFFKKIFQGQNRPLPLRRH